jgi:hypothetical protein
MKLHAFISRKETSVRRLTNLFVRGIRTIKIVSVGKATRVLAEDTGVIPGNALDDAVTNVDYGG